MEEKNSTQYNKLTDNNTDNNKTVKAEDNQKSDVKLSLNDEELSQLSYSENESTSSDISSNATYKYVFLILITNIFTYFLYNMSRFMEIKFISQTLDKSLLNGINLAYLYQNILIKYPFYGLIQCISIIGSKSFGKKNYRLLGQQINHVRVITFVYFILYLIISCFFAGRILKLMGGKDPIYLDIAHKYVLYTLPVVFLDIQYNIYYIYSEAMLQFKPLIYSIIVIILSHPLLCYLFIVVFNLHLAGVTYAAVISHVIKLAQMVIYFYFFNPFPSTHFFINRETFRWHSFKDTLSLSLITMVVIFSEYLGFNVILIYVNKLSELTYSKAIIIFTLGDVIYNIGVAWMISNSNMIGNYIGRASPRNVRETIKISFHLLIIIVAPVLILFLIFRRQLFVFLSNDEKLSLQQDVSPNMILLFCGLGLKVAGCYLIGILRECGNIVLISAISTAVFSVFMPILSYILTFVVDLQLLGSTIGISISYFLVFGIFLGLYFNIDIENACKEYKRVHKNSIEMETAYKADADKNYTDTCEVENLNLIEKNK